MYKSIVEGCVTDGIHDCTALAPTPKVTCEKRDPRFVYVLDEFAASGLALYCGQWVFQMKVDFLTSAESSTMFGLCLVESSGRTSRWPNP